MYKVELTHQAEKDLAMICRSDRTLYARFLTAFEVISKDPDEGKALHGELRGLTSYRFGSYRVIYEIRRKQLVVIVLDLGHRRDIYK